MDSLISQPTEFMQLDIGGGVIMDAWMIKPAGFDPAKKYPVTRLRVWRATRPDRYWTPGERSMPTTIA